MKRRRSSPADLLTAVLPAILLLDCGGAFAWPRVALGRRSERTEATGKEAQLHQEGVAGVLNTMPADTRHVFVMMPLRDGVRLATDLFVPPGDGSWPAVLLRTPYARWDARVYQAMEGAPCVAVMQNVRGRYGSEGAGTFPGESFDNEVNDSYDAIEWVAGQKWCNGKVGMWGPSGHGVAAAAALWSQSPHLTMADTNITGDNAYMY